MDKVLNKWFHAVANEGKEISDYREHHKQLSELPAKRIEILFQLAKLKKQFFKS